MGGVQSSEALAGLKSAGRRRGQPRSALYDPPGLSRTLPGGHAETKIAHAVSTTTKRSRGWR